MNIIILSGFLGAGKTTFLQELSKHLGDMVIIENDYARDIDRELLSKENRSIYSIDEGCACCTRGEELETAILSIANTINPEHLVIEPTGLAALSSLIARIKNIEYEQIKLLCTINIVDLTHFSKTLEDFSDLFIDQVRSSAHIIFSKSEHARTEDFSAAKQQLSAYTSATIHTTHYSNFSEDDWLGLLNQQNSYDAHSDHFAHEQYQTLSYTNVHFGSSQEMGTTFQAIIQGRLGTVLRAKGFVFLNNQLMKVDIVGDEFSCSPYSSEHANELLFIGRDLDEDAFSLLFEQYYTK